MNYRRRCRLSTSSSSSSCSDDEPPPASSMICVRYDFDKPAPSEAAAPPPSNNNGSRPTSPALPASPETRKKELCTYLQLMQPGERAQPAPASARRSRRLPRPAEPPPLAMPLPPARAYEAFADFEPAVYKYVHEVKSQPGARFQRFGRRKFRFNGTRRRYPLRSRGLIDLLSLGSLRQRRALRRPPAAAPRPAEQFELGAALELRLEEEEKPAELGRLSHAVLNLPNVERAKRICAQILRGILRKGAAVLPPDHDYARRTPDSGEEPTPEPAEEPTPEPADAIEPEITPLTNAAIIPLNRKIIAESLHRCLNKRKIHNRSGLWTIQPEPHLDHAVKYTAKNGKTLKCFYLDNHLILIQEKRIGFWTQSALGDLLGTQDMWLPKGETERLPLNSTYMHKQTEQMIISMENSVAYVELWMKEHKSDFRERPLSDVFATVYFWRVRQVGIDKKALQLESIKARFEDVQYMVVRATPRIVVSWYALENDKWTTKIRSYFLASDYQTVASINEIQAVSHFVRSLHSIEERDNLVMGYGEDKVTLWNLDYGYIVATIEMNCIKSAISTLWIKCDRGFLFMVQECEGEELQLVAINGLKCSWKKLQSYTAPSGFDCVKGVYIENGILMGYFKQGVVCWNAQSGQLLLEEQIVNEKISDYVPSEKYIIIMCKEQIIVRHSLSHLITSN